MKRVILTIFLLTIISTFGMNVARADVPQVAPKLDYSGFVKCDGVVDPKEPDRQRVCDFAALMETINKLINWLFIITIPVVVALFAYGGLLYLTGKDKNIGKAKNIFTSAAIGFIIMLVAWVVVYTLVNWLINPQFKGATTLIEQKK